MPFRIYIDESGEAGLLKVRGASNPGASPHFVLGAAVFEGASEISARKALSEFKSTISKSSWKHATDLGHAEKVLLARTLGSLPARYFAVWSNKSTLGSYKDDISSDPQKFYNKCLQYLLEKVCAYLGGTGATEEDLKIYLERRNHDYDSMLRYFGKVKDNPIHPESRALKVLNPFSISVISKGEDELLEVADFVAHAVFQLGNKTKSNYNIPEWRYFVELSSRFAPDERGVIVGTGLKCIHSLDDLGLDPDVREVVRRARAKLPSTRTVRNQKR